MIVQKIVQKIIQSFSDKRIVYLENDKNIEGQFLEIKVLKKPKENLSQL